MCSKSSTQSPSCRFPHILQSKIVPFQPLRLTPLQQWQYLSNTSGNCAVTWILAHQGLDLRARLFIYGKSRGVAAVICGHGQLARRQYLDDGELEWLATLVSSNWQCVFGASKEIYNVFHLSESAVRWRISDRAFLQRRRPFPAQSSDLAVTRTVDTATLCLGVYIMIKAEVEYVTADQFVRSRARDMVAGYILSNNIPNYSKLDLTFSLAYCVE
jgi:hypothetical protein